MKTLRERRLTREVQERVIMNDGNLKQSFQEVLDHLYKTHEWNVDNDKHLQALEIWEDILELRQMINKYNTLQD